MKKVLNLLLTLVLTLSLVVVLAACGKKKIPGTKKEGVLVVGMECDYAPFNWTETKASDTNIPISNVAGAYAEGYDVQMAKKIAKELNLALEIKSLTWDALIPSLKNGTIDMIIAGMSPTEERKKSISFTEGYYTSTHVMVVKSDSKYTTATQLSDFKDATVAGQTGTIYADLVPQAVAAGAKAGTDMNTVPQLVNQIKQGILDATIVERPVAQGLVAADNTLAYVEFAEGKGFNVAIEDVMVSIGIRQECNFTDKINAALAKISTAERDQMMLTAVQKNSAE